MTIKEIDKKISELKRERKVLEDEKRKEFLESAKENIGRCFKVNNVLAKVIDVPKVEETMTGTYFNEYQYPAIFLKDEDGMPFYIDTLFSGAWGIGHDVINKYEEVSKEEFNAEFDLRIAEFIEMIKEK